MNEENFKAYCDKRFVQDQHVIAHSMGPSIPGEYEAIIRGVHAMEPFEDYIIEWVNPEEMKKFYYPGKSWTHCVLTKACLRAA